MRKDEKGFALVLSLVLMLVMSLMGGALIVISAGDHQSNNSSDEYQQTFYVAETALLQAQKSLINKSRVISFIKFIVILNCFFEFFVICQLKTNFFFCFFI